MTKAVLEAEGEGEARSTAAAVPSPAVAVPASLHASLMARLDRLGPAKEVAQIGAAIGRQFSHALLVSVVRRPQPELTLALDRLIGSGLLSRQGAPPHATYLFKHALVQDAAYGTLLREPRRALHAQIAEALESEFPELADRQPELLARHCTEAGLLEKAAGLWGKAGQRSLQRSAMVEAREQLTRALDQLAALPGTAALRRQQVKLQVALVNALMHVRGHAAPETKAAVERARVLIEQAQALGEPLEDPLLLFSVLYGIWTANFLAFNAGVVRELSPQFLALAEKQGVAVARMIGHRLVANTLAFTGDLAASRAHYDQAVALYDPATHRPLATRFGVELGTVNLCFRGQALWLLGYPDAALADAERALRDARDSGHAGTVMYVLSHSSLINVLCGKYAAPTARFEELHALADEKGASIWKSQGMMNQGSVLALTGRTADAIRMLTAALAAFRASTSTLFTPFWAAHLAWAHAQAGQFDDAWRCVGETMAVVETTGEVWWLADIHRVAGEIALLSAPSDAAKAATHFERALEVARGQQAKSLELRAATSLARLMRDQDRRDEARALLAPVYGWFSEGFDSLDLTQAKALLDELQASQPVSSEPIRTRRGSDLRRSENSAR